ncbi:MAG: NAD(P)/FAD-dependent oxidoreductase [Clostridium sp.]|nr:NAD(P)/FAD-dependent oxidoreductase [Clostridium sp.]
MIRVYEVKLAAEEDLERLKEKIAKKLNISPLQILDYRVFKESIDARKKNEVYFVYIVDVQVKDEAKVLRKNKNLQKSPVCTYQEIKAGDKTLRYRPIVIGTGPAGMFCGLLLAQRGYKPILLERGQDVDTRAKDVAEFWRHRKLNTESNVQFGEGGAGTFSDGKLTARIKDIRSQKVLEEFVFAGAPPEILYASKPHIGTDILKSVVKNMREQIIALGGEVRFGCKVTDFCLKDGQIVGVKINGAKSLNSDVVVLATGHSARDTYELLDARGIQLKQKPFSIGVRIEHPQELINRVQYGQKAECARLGVADYRLTYQSKLGRAVYTFCMCPGGTVIAAASEADTVVTNGMSEFARDRQNANSALLVQINTTDFAGSHPLAGIEFQRKWERAAFELGGANYSAPVQRVEDFLSDRPTVRLGKVQPSYLPAVKCAELKKCLPEYVFAAMREAIVELDKKLQGFALPDAIMTGVETRSSAPLRIERNSATMESINTRGLYPVGEGAGYAGGIISASVDGIKAAEKIISNYRPSL